MIERTVICPNCQNEFSEYGRYCSQCGKPRSFVTEELSRLSAVTDTPIDDLIELDRAGDPLPPYPVEARQRILQRSVHALSDRGWQILSQTDTTAQLKKPKQFDCMMVFLTLLFGLGIIIYVLTAEPTIYLEVDESGILNATGQVNPDVTRVVREMNATVSR